MSEDNNIVTVRPVNQEDFEEWLSLWKGYQLFYEHDIPMEVTEETWKRFFDEKEHVYAAVAVIDGKLIGLVHYLFHRTTWYKENYCYLQDLFVDPNHRSKGIGKKLIEYVQKMAKESNASKLYLHTHNDNSRARRLYDYVGTLSGFIKYDIPI